MRYFFLIIMLLSPTTACASRLEFTQQPNAVRIGDTFATSLVLHSDTDSINALEGSVLFDSALSLIDIRLAGSLVPLWVTPPVEKEKGNVSFAGVLPGGYQGDGTVFTLVFKAIQKGTAHISLSSDTAAYKDDGRGTKATLVLSKYILSVGSASGAPQTVQLEADNTPPETFLPSINSGTPFGLDGPVLIFTTQDKNSGIASYEIARSYASRAKEESLTWRTVQSPYVLEAGDSTYYLYVRAVDRAGNTRVVTIPPQEFSPIAVVLLWWPLLLIGLLGAIILFIRYYRR